MATTRRGGSRRLSRHRRLLGADTRTRRKSRRIIYKPDPRAYACAGAGGGRTLGAQRGRRFKGEGRRRDDFSGRGLLAVDGWRSPSRRGVRERRFQLDVLGVGAEARRSRGLDRKRFRRGSPDHGDGGGASADDEPTPPRLRRPRLPALSRKT